MAVAMASDPEVNVRTENTLPSLRRHEYSMETGGCFQSSQRINCHKQCEQSPFSTTAANYRSRLRQTKILTPKSDCWENDSSFFLKKEEEKKHIRPAHITNRGAKCKRDEDLRSHFLYVQPFFLFTALSPWKRVNSALIPQDYKAVGHDFCFILCSEATSWSFMRAVLAV